MEELLDIVNELDEVIGQATRSDVHLNQHLHRSTHIILTNSKRQIFLQLRSMSKDTNPGLWDSSAAGHVEAGESYADCAARELEEELGVKVAVEQLLEIGQLQPAVETGNEFVRIYAAMSDGQITLEAGEIDDGRWFDKADVDAWILEKPQELAPSFLVIWEVIRSWRASL